MTTTIHKRDGNGQPLPPPDKMDSVLMLPISWAAEKMFRALPEWKAYGLFPEAYTALKGGFKEAFNFEKHFHGQNLGDLPDNVGFQNAWSIANFAGGVTKVEYVYTFRRDVDGLETPIAYKTHSTGTPTDAQLSELGEKSINKEEQIGSMIMDRLVNHKSIINGDFERAGCMGEITDMDSKQAPDPTAFEPIYASHEIFLTGQKGERTKVTTTTNGQVWAYKVITPMQKLETYTRTDLRYTMRNWPIEKLGLENMFEALGLQRMLTSLAAGTTKAEQDDYVQVYGPGGIPIRSDGIRNPFSSYLDHTI